MKGLESRGGIMVFPSGLMGGSLCDEYELFDVCSPAPHPCEPAVLEAQVRLLRAPPVVLCGAWLPLQFAFDERDNGSLL